VSVIAEVLKRLLALVCAPMLFGGGVSLLIEVPRPFRAWWRWGLVGWVVGSIPIPIPYWLIAITTALVLIVVGGVLVVLGLWCLARALLPKSWFE
jgi:hypothetical protein